MRDSGGNGSQKEGLRWGYNSPRVPMRRAHSRGGGPVLRWRKRPDWLLCGPFSVLLGKIHTSG